jgi:sugar lactone lactonase YvrE
MPRRPPIDPVVWQPPAHPERARRSTGSDPLPEPRLLPLNGHGPEDVVVDAEGWLVTGVEDGRILRVHPEGRELHVVGDTGGRPLGLEITGDGDVLVCDSHRGLLRLDPGSGALTTLVDHVDGQPMRFCSNAVAVADGTIYFTESTTRFGFEHWRAAIIEGRATGRLLRRSPDGAVEVLLDGLMFANGVVVAPDGDSVVVAETGAYRLTRYWLAGPHEGRSDVVVDNLPGFPDNLSLTSGGDIWIAMANPRDRMLDWLHRKPPLLRRAVWALPGALRPDVTPTVWAMAVSFDGEVVADLQGPGRNYRMVTGLAEHDGRLYLASIQQRELAVVDLPPRV